MTPILDPVWPWSRLWEVLQQVPPAMRFIAGVAALAALVSALLYMGRGTKTLLAGFGRSAGRPASGHRSVVFLSALAVLAMSLVLDHYGLLGVPERPLDLTRIVGVLCLVAGVVLIRWL